MVDVGEGPGPPLIWVKNSQKEEKPAERPITPTPPPLHVAQSLDLPLDLGENHLLYSC